MMTCAPEIGAPVTSSTTNDAVDERAPEVGDAVPAIIGASDVTVGK